MGMKHGKRSWISEYVEMETMDEQIACEKAIQGSKTAAAQAKADSVKAKAQMQGAVARKAAGETIKTDLDGIEQLCKTAGIAAKDIDSYKTDYAKDKLEELYGIKVE